MKHIFWSVGLITIVACISGFAMFVAILASHHFQIRFAHHQAMRRNIASDYLKETLPVNVLKVFYENYGGEITVKRFETSLFPNAMRFGIERKIGGYTYSLDRLMVEEYYAS